MSPAEATAPMASLPGKQLNPKQIDMLKGLRNGALLPQLLRTYRDDAKVQIDKIRAAVAANDLPVVVSSTHSLKSASFSIGADGIGALCAAMESAARGGALPNGPELGSQLASLYSSLLPELESFLTP
jgi:HPt (histidine-containing phosphotransfer) domain-containing protein